MDTKRLEQIGETFIISKLLDAGILVAKPHFDCLGTDLVGFTSIDDKARFCRIQCKYRELKTTTSVQVDSKYVIGAFILFLYIKNSNNRHFYCLLPDDIKRIFDHKDAVAKKLFRLSITKRTILTLENDPSITFTQKKVSDISELMKTSSPDTEFRRIVKGFVQKYKQLTEEQAALKKLIHDFELTSLKRQALEEKITILEEYRGLMQKYYEEQVQKEEGNV
jgi:hypothetical protein